MCGDYLTCKAKTGANQSDIVSAGGIVFTDIDNPQDTCLQYISFDDLTYSIDSDSITFHWTKYSGTWSYNNDVYTL